MARENIYPVGQQSFSVIRENDYIYVDKTRYFDLITKEGLFFFLGRPRRFGKSLFLSTMKCFFEGRRELFKGLYADTMDWDWEPRPVLYIDLNVGSFTNGSHDLEELIDNMLSDWEKEYGVTQRAETHSARFRDVIKGAYEKTGKKVVILVDEYDKPLVNNLNDPEGFKKYRNILYGFYSNFKSSSDYLQLVFLTGVSRFGKLSIFSGLNNLKDISFDSRYSAICGITESELLDNFQEGIQEFADKKGITYQESIETVKKWYDGYHFCDNSEDMYNPFSLLCLFDSQKLSNYWMMSGGKPTILIESLRHYNGDLSQFVNSRCSQEALIGIEMDAPRPLALFYQTGYLTIKDYDEENDIYTLGLPNFEVTRGFMNYLLPYYANLNTEDSAFVVSEFVREFRGGKVDGFMTRLQRMFAKTSYKLKIENENNLQNALYILMTLVGLYVQAELCTSDGRIDLFVATNKFYYIIELKVDSTPEDALRQIEEKNYALPFTLDGRKIIKIGVNFSTDSRTITGWQTSLP